jgi:phenylacetate-CoA ligase
MGILSRRVSLGQAYRALPAPARRVASAAYGLVPFPWNAGWAFGRLHQRFWRSQHATAEQLAALQLGELRRVAQHAYDTVPAYRERFVAAGLQPADLRTLADWRAFPITTKAELQDDPESFVSEAVPANERVRRTTSGSTGTPLVIYTTPATQLAERAIMYRGWRWSGYASGDRIVTCVGELTGPRLGSDHAPYGRHRTDLELSPHHLSEAACRAYLKLMGEFEPAFFRTYPSIAQLLGKLMRDEKLPVPKVKAIWTQSEVLRRAERRLLEEQWQTRVYDYYGMQEKCVAMSECEYGRLHVHSEFGLVELIPSDNPPFSHIVATGFYNAAMPLLRYDTRDLAVPASEPCACGRALPAIQRIVGRLEDFLLASDGSQVMEVDAAIGDLTAIRECQIIQETLTRTHVMVVPGPCYDDRTEGELRRRLLAALGDGVELSIERRASIPRTATGKQRFIVSKVKPGWAL